MPPLTILVPSGENWTEEMEPNGPLVCAFCFSLINVRESVSKMVQLRHKESGEFYIVSHFFLYHVELHSHHENDNSNYWPVTAEKNLKSLNNFSAQLVSEEKKGALASKS